MNNIIAKTALKTLLVLIIAAILAFGVASLGFPQHMATLFENLNGYSFATGYAGLAYSYSRTIENLSRCVDDSILAGDYVNVINYGELLVSEEDFVAFAAERTSADREKLSTESASDYNYYHVVYGNLACAKYNRGDSEGALATAKESLPEGSGFPANNAYAALAVRANLKSDAQFLSELYNAVKVLTPNSGEEEYYEAVMAILT